MHEIVMNTHIHTRYSDGRGTHRDIAQAAIQAGLDAVLVTDHNVWVQGVEGYYRKDKQRLLLLVGEEIHEQDRQPQKNHLLAMGIDRELAPLASDTQHLVDQIRKIGGASFIAHPIDPALPIFNEGDISWVDWKVYGYNGIELWNGFSELKTVIKGKLDGLFYAFFPKAIARGPLPETLKLWDDLLEHGQRVVAIGGSDAHAQMMSMGPIHRVIFPYYFHFLTVNTHMFIPEPLSGDLATDRRMILDALSAGHAFVGYDLPASTRGFRFSAQGKDKTAIMGDEIPAAGGVTLQARLPKRGKIRMIKDGQVVQVWSERETCAYFTSEPGIYRVEAYRSYLGRVRGWIFSNPIYLK